MSAQPNGQSEAQLGGRWWPTDARRPWETRAEWLARIDSYTNAPEAQR